MRRFRALLCITAVFLLIISASRAYALEVVSISPADGSKGYQPQNMAIKVTFSEVMLDGDDEDVIELNGNKFSIKAEDGGEIPYSLTYNAKKYPNQLWVILSEDLASDAEYTFEIKPGVLSASGGILAEGTTTTFRTRNTKTDAWISSALMIALMGVMFYATSRATKKAAAESDPVAAEKAALAKLNPYKMAKEKGISVEEARAIVDKEKDRIARKVAKIEEEQRKREEALKAEMALVEAEMDAREEAERRAMNYRVKTLRSVKEAGGRIPKSVIKANKAKREAAEKAAREKARPANKKKR